MRWSSRLHSHNASVSMFVSEVVREIQTCRTLTTSTTTPIDVSQTRKYGSAVVTAFIFASTCRETGSETQPTAK
jgi:hypothetical protein